MSRISEIKLFEVPATISEAITTANILGELAIAATWKRSAIVRAFVSKSVGGRPRKDENLSESLQVSIAQFAKLGIVGLRDRETVARYYDAWELTGLPEPEPGKTTDLPPAELEFPAVAPAHVSKAINPPERHPHGSQSHADRLSDLSACEHTDGEIVDAEIVYDDDSLPPMTNAEAGQLIRQAKDAIPDLDRAWEHWRRCRDLLLDVRNDLRNDLLPSGPTADATIASFWDVVSEVKSHLERLS